MDFDESNELIQLGVAASLGRKYAEDQREFVIDLASTLESAMPEHVVVERKGGLFGGERITGLQAQFGSLVYILGVPAKGPLQPALAKVVRGIKLKTDPLAMEDWLALLSEEIYTYAQNNLKARDALKRLIGD